MGKKGEEQGRLFTYFQLNWAWNLGAVLTANGSLRRRHTCSSGQGCCPGCDPTFGPSAPEGWGGVGGWGRDQGPPDTWPDVFETFCTQNYLQIFYFLRLFSLSIGAFATPTPPDWH